MRNRGLLPKSVDIGTREGQTPLHSGGDRDALVVTRVSAIRGKEGVGDAERLCCWILGGPVSLKYWRFDIENPVRVSLHRGSKTDRVR